jgi:hypothetical protein
MAGRVVGEGEGDAVARLGRLELTAMPLNPIGAAAEGDAALGVDRLVVYPLPFEDPDDIARFLEQHARLAGGCSTG